MKKITSKILILIILMSTVLPCSNVIAAKTILPTISASTSNSSFYLKTNGDVWACGQNSSGQLGDGTNENKIRPVKIDISDVIQVAGGHNFTAFLKSNGDVYICGSSIGNVPIKAPISNVKQIAVGRYNIVCLKDNGEVWTDGINSYGQFGNGTVNKTNHKFENVFVKADISDVKQVTVGESFTIALKNNGEVWGWGNNSSGQLGDESLKPHYTPIRINISNVKQVSAGGLQVAALKNNGEVWEWGQNWVRGEHVYEPKQVNISNVKQVSAGGLHTAALKNNGEVWGWGYNYFNVIESTSNNPVKLKISDVSQIISSYAHIIAIKKNGDVWTWGSNHDGRLGLGHTNDVSYPVFNGFNICSINVRDNNIDEISNNIETKLDDILKSMTICDATVLGPCVSIWKYDIYPLKFSAKAVLDLTKFSKNITIDEDKKTVHVLIGKKNQDGKASIVQTTKTCDASWSKQYNEVKDLYKSMTGFEAKGSSGGINNWNRFEKMKGELNRLKCDFIIDADMSLLGYIDFDYQTGALQFSEGGIIETASLGVELKHGQVIYAALGLKGSEEGTIKLTSTDNGVEPYMSLKPGLTATAKLGANLGAKLEGGVDATLSILLQTAEPNFKVLMNGNLFYTLTVPLVNITSQGKIPYLNCELYPEFKNNIATLMSLEEPAVEPIDRSYLDKVLTMSVSDENSILTLNSVYPYNNAQLIRLSGNSMMLVWVGDDGSKSDPNRSSLMYSIYGNGIWSGAQTINEDGTAVGDFKAVTDGETVYIVYQKMSEAVDDDTELSESTKLADLYCTEYKNNNFSESMKINTDNELFEALGDVSVNENGLDVVWVENSENDILLSKGTNTIKEYKNNTVKTIAEFTASSKEYISGICAGNDSVYYSVSNSEDSTSAVYKYNKEVTQEFSCDNIVSNLEMFDGKLYYLKDSAVCFYDGNEEKETGIAGIDDFKIVTNGQNIAMLSSIFNGKGSELYVNKFENDCWLSHEQFTDLGKYIKSYSPFMYDDGTINVAVSAAAVNDEVEDKVFGDTSVMVLNQCDYFDLATSYLYYDGDISPNNNINLYFDVTNNSASEINSIKVKLTDGNGNILDNKTIQCSISPYATEVLNMPYTLPDNITLSTINLEISSEKEEKSLSNNSVSVSYGYSNVKVMPLNYEILGNNTAEVKTTIKNDGFSAAENVVIRVYDGSKNGNILEEKNIGTLNTGDVYELSYTFSKELMNSKEDYMMNAVYVMATTSSEETAYSDNEEKAVFESAICRIDSITLDENTLNVGITKNFKQKNTLIAAAYTKENKLCEMQYKTIDSDGSFDFDLDTTEAAYISVFLWDDLKGMIPLSEKKTYTITN